MGRYGWDEHADVDVHDGGGPQDDGPGDRPEPAFLVDRALDLDGPLDDPDELVGDADPARYATALTACLEDDNVDGVLAILTPQAMTDPTQAARAVIEAAKQSDKPLVTCWMGEEQVREARMLFKGAGMMHELIVQLSIFYERRLRVDAA